MPSWTNITTDKQINHLLLQFLSTFCLHMQNTNTKCLQWLVWLCGLGIQPVKNLSGVVLAPFKKGYLLSKEKETKNVRFKWSYPKKEIFLIAKQMVKERHNITGSNCLKRVSGKVIVEEKGLKIHGRSTLKSWWMKKMNGISATVKEGPADCIRIDEVAAALKQMKRQSPRHLRASSRNDTIHKGYWNSVDTGFM